MSRVAYKEEIRKGLLERMDAEERKRYLIWQYFFVPNMKENSGLWRRIIDNLFSHQERTVSVEVLQSEYIENFQEEKSRDVSIELQAEAVLRVNDNDLYRVCYPISNGGKNCLHIFKISAVLMEGENRGLQGELKHRILVLENKKQAIQENEVYLPDCTHETLRKNHLEELIPLLMLVLFYDSDEERRYDRVFWLTYVKAGLESIIKEKNGWAELYFTRKVISIWSDVCKEIFKKDFGLSLEIQYIFLPYLLCESGMVDNKSRAELEAKHAIAYIQMRENMMRKMILHEKENGMEPEKCVQKLQTEFALSAEEVVEKMKKYDFGI